MDGQNPGPAARQTEQIELTFLDGDFGAHKGPWEGRWKRWKEEEGDRYLGCMAGGFDSKGGIKGGISERHVGEVSLHRCEQSRQSRLRDPISPHFLRILETLF